MMDGLPQAHVLPPQVASDTFVLEARNLRVTAGGKNLLDSVSLRLQPGECLMLLGPNGAGKSTLLRALAGELKPGQGSVAVLGRPLDAWHGRELARVRGVLPQQCAVQFPVTAAEVVDLGLPTTLRGEARARVRAELLDWLEVAHLARRIYPSLSGGEQQRVQIARVLGQVWRTPGPRLLLLDECTSALDPAQQHAVMAMLKSLSRAAGIGVIVTSHDLGLAATYADRVALMRDGRIITDATPREALTTHKLAAVYDLQARVRWEPSPSVEIQGALNTRNPTPPNTLETSNTA